MKNIYKNGVVRTSVAVQPSAGVGGSARKRRSPTRRVPSDAAAIGEQTLPRHETIDPRIHEGVVFQVGEFRKDLGAIVRRDERHLLMKFGQSGDTFGFGQSAT